MTATTLPRSVATGADRSPGGYSAYKDSGVEWLGGIPAHWETRRLKTIASVELSNVDKKSYEGDEPIRLCNYTHVYNNERITADMDFMPATATAEQIRRLTLREGAVLVTKDSESWDDIAVAALVGPGDWRGVVCGYHLAVVRPADAEMGQYLARAFSAIGVREQFYAASNGITRFALGGDAIRTALFPVPPMEERRAIVAFIDRQTARIDGLVAKKERLIELLLERRTALITHAVTKGLDPNVPMKESGVTWLGEIPAHWTAKPLKAVLSRNDAGVWGQDSDDDGVIVLRSTDQTVDGRWAIERPARRRLTSREASDARLAVDDMVVTMSSGSELHIGKTSIVDESVASLNCCFSNFMHRLRVAKGNEARYFWYLLNSPAAREQQIFWSSTTTGLGNLTGSILDSIRIPAAPLAEQRLITAFLDRETAKIDALVSGVRGAMGHLGEVRTALISAAVTGKIDVRERAVA